MKHSNISLFVTHMGCPHQCSFCNQKTISGYLKELSAEDVAATLEEASTHGNDPKTTEIAFFGGSFTAIDRAYMVTLLEATRPYIEKGLFCGIRVSTRPDAIDEDVLAVLKKYGVTSIELGAQSTDENVLKFNHRGHSRSDIFNASRMIKANGFSLGLQMMTGLLGDTDEKALATCDDIISLKPDTVRIYPTIVLEGTYLAELYKKGEYLPQSLENAVALCARLLKRFYDNNITVIRLGLHSGGNVEDGYVAGPYHEAFGELCESRIYLALAKEILQGKVNGKKVIYVNPREISKMTGQKQINKKSLLDLGYDVVIKGKDALSKYEIEIQDIS